MNLEDVIDPEYGLQQDEWSLSKPRFGEEGQLEVVGWSGKAGSNKYYIIKCVVCSKDPELFGEGYFKSLKGGLNRGHSPCGCVRPRWSKEQYATLCYRKAAELGYTFLGFTGRWEGNTTKVKMLCEKHGEWGSGNINSLVSGGKGCPYCKVDVWVEAVTVTNTKPDSEMIASFFASGAFHPDTKFWRSGRKTSRGRCVNWFMSCPDCGETGESVCSSLQKGSRSCAL